MYFLNFSSNISFVNELSFTSINLDNFYFNTLNNKINSEKIIDSIFSQKIKLILLDLYPEDQLNKIRENTSIYEIKDIIGNFKKFKCEIDIYNEWKISDDDYSLIINICKVFNPNISLGLFHINLLEEKYAKDTKCGFCGESLFLHPYYTIYEPVYAHYFCYIHHKLL